MKCYREMQTSDSIFLFVSASNMLAFSHSIPVIPLRHLQTSTRLLPRQRNVTRKSTVMRVRRSENVAGDFYVDSSCIDCDACRCKFENLCELNTTNL